MRAITLLIASLVVLPTFSASLVVLPTFSADEPRPCQYGINNTNPESYPDYYNGARTASQGKVSCIRWMFQVHVTFTISLVFLGIINPLLSLSPKTVSLHPYVGRFYIFCMLCATFAALLIHNTGLPLAVILNFVVALVCLAVAWASILVHKAKLTAQAEEKVSQSIEQSGSIQPPGASLQEAISIAMGEIEAAKTWKEKFLSLKTLHAVCMITNWFQFAGRYVVILFACANDTYGHCYKRFHGTFQFECYSYPVYKPGVENWIFCNDTNTNKLWKTCSSKGWCPVLQNSTETSPWDESQPGSFYPFGLVPFVVLMTLIPLVLAASIALCLSCKRAKKQKKD